MSRWSLWQRKVGSARRRREHFPSSIRLELWQLDTRFLPGETIGAGSLAWLTAATALYEFWQPGKSTLAQESRNGSGNDLHTDPRNLSLTRNASAEPTAVPLSGTVIHRRDSANLPATNTSPAQLDDFLHRELDQGLIGSSGSERTPAELAVSAGSTFDYAAWSALDHLLSGASQNNSASATVPDSAGAGLSALHLDSTNTGSYFLPGRGASPPASSATVTTQPSTGLQPVNAHNPYIKTVAHPATRPPSGVVVIPSKQLSANPTPKPPLISPPPAPASGLDPTITAVTVTPLISDPGNY
jgi:hypothetical protein